MRRVCLLFALFAVSLTVICAVGSASELRPEDRNEYNANALSLSVKTKTDFYSGSYSITSDFDLGWVGSETSLKWTPFRGNTPMSKEDFYVLTGYEAEAQRYMAFRKSRRLWNWISWSSLAAGTAMVVIAAIIGNSSEEISPTEVALLIPACCCYALSTFGFIKLDFFLDESELFSVSFAANICDTFNAGLLAKYSY
ncbi:MAG: hypothetical protein J5785_03930 [Spirochaetales bacterium]|nr:hypothetical protein [Spirochaetales bacterium]